MSPFFTSLPLTVSKVDVAIADLPQRERLALVVMAPLLVKWSYLVHVEERY